MPARPQWKGYLKLSLVSCPIALYPALSPAKRISFRQVHAKTGNRLRQQLVDAVTGEVIEHNDKARGYEIAENQFLFVKDEELEAAEQEARLRPFVAAPPSAPARPEAARGELPRVTAPSLSRAQPRGVEVPEPEDESEAVEAPEPLLPPPRIENNRTIELDRFVTANEIDPRYHDTPYYIVPREPIGQEAFAVIREAMREAKMAGMGRVVLAKRERPILVEPFGKGLRGMTLRYAHEVREPEEYFAEIPDLILPSELRDIAEHILRTKAGSFDPAFLEDRYRTVLIEKLGDKKRITALHKRGTAEASPENVIDLMDALKRSLAAEGSTALSKSHPKQNASITRIAAAGVPPKLSPRRTAATVKTVAMKRAGGRGQKTR